MDSLEYAVLLCCLALHGIHGDTIGYATWRVLGFVRASCLVPGYVMTRLRGLQCYANAMEMANRTGHGPANGLDTTE